MTDDMTWRRRLHPGRRVLVHYRAWRVGLALRAARLDGDFDTPMGEEETLRAVLDSCKLHGWVKSYSIQGYDVAVIISDRWRLR